MDDSIADQKAFLATNPDGSSKFNAMYELGLAQVEKEAWADVIAIFGKLLADDSDSSRADRYHYELAWAHQGLNQPVNALEHFAVIAEQFPGSPLAPESNFHLGTAAYQNDEFPAAIAAYEKCVSAGETDNGAKEGTNLVREKAFYKLGWAHYKQKQYEDAYQKFAQQVETFPEGELFADGVFMVAESQFRQKNYEAALAAYLAAKPDVDDSDSVDPNIKLLTMLHGSQSANKTRKWDAALQLVTPLTTGDVDTSFQYDAWLEIGTANEGLGKTEEAMTAWGKAKLSNSPTGARAACMIGDVLFKQKKLDDAISEFKLVFYRFGSADTSDDIKPWVAYALYEAARCSLVQVADAPAEKKAGLVSEALKQFELLIANYPADRLAPEAQKQIEKLKQLQ
jgi:TolA-binding protein